MIVKINEQEMTGDDIVVFLPSDANRISIFYSTDNGASASSAVTGTTYTVSYRPKGGFAWFPLNDENDSQLSGTLAEADTETKSVLNLGYVKAGDTPLLGGMEYKIDIESDENADAVIQCSVAKLSIPVVAVGADSDPAIVFTGYHQLKDSNSNAGSDSWGYTNVPSIHADDMNLTLVDLSTDDPNFPTTEVNYAIVYCVSGITSDGANAAIVQTQTLVGTPSDDGTDLLINDGDFYTGNTSARAGHAEDNEDQKIHYVRMNNNKIVVGLNTIEENGSNAFGSINVIGYVK